MVERGVVPPGHLIGGALIVHLVERNGGSGGGLTTGWSFELTWNWPALRLQECQRVGAQCASSSFPQRIVTFPPRTS